MSNASNALERAMEIPALQVGGHALSIGAIVGTIFGWLPYVAALFGIVWYAIQIYESRTFQHWKNNWLMKRRAKKLAKLRAKEKVTLAKIAALETVRHAKTAARELVADAASEAAKIVAEEPARLAAEQLAKGPTK